LKNNKLNFFYQQSWLLAGLLLFILASIIYIKLYIIFPAKKNLIETALVDSNCDLHKSSCSAVLSENRAITLTILPRDIPLLKPLNIQVQLKNIKATAVNLEITGINLNMGRFRTKLKHDGDFIYQGISSLPVCSKKVMKWKAMISVNTNNGVISAPFFFTTSYTPTFIILE